MSPQQQRFSLGISAISYEGLVIVELEGSSIIAMSPAEALRHRRYFDEALRQAVRDQDVLQERRNRKPLVTVEAHGEFAGERRG